MRFFFLSLMILLYPRLGHSQGCCSGGSGSPIAGGTSQGVLAYQQMELSSSFQYISSRKLKGGDKFVGIGKETLSSFDNFNSKYLYSKVGYGISKEFTFSLETGYYFNKTQVDTEKNIIASSGIGDLILFPKYDVVNRADSSKRVEFTLGLGYKIPLGKNNDSNLVYTNPLTGQEFFTTSPPLVQPTNGSQDVIFYAFFLRGFPKHNFKVFANALYIRKGWNSLGQKFGDYKSVGIFAGKTFYKTLGVTLQVKGEWIDVMKYHEDIDMLAFYNIDVNSTGSKKILFVPQLSYSFSTFTLYGLYELPIYEYVNGIQVATQQQVTVGLSYRFFTTKNPACKPGSGETYQCTMRCEGGGGNAPGKCKVCGMKLKKVK